MNPTKEQLLEKFKKLGATGLTYSHYDLAEVTDVSNPEIWKQFLLDSEISNWISTELTLIRNSELNKMLKDINDSNSVGKAQLMSTILKMNESSLSKEGATFIYTYVPLSEEQKSAPNVRILNNDPFLD